MKVVRWLASSRGAAMEEMGRVRGGEVVQSFAGDEEDIEVDGGASEDDRG